MSSEPAAAAVEVNDPGMLGSSTATVRGRAGLHGVPVLRGADLEPAGSRPVFQRHARRCAAPVERAGRRRRSAQSEQQVQRHDLRRRRQPLRVRARDQLAGDGDARRRAPDVGHTLAGQGTEQPERRRRAIGRRRLLHAIRPTGGCPGSGSSGRRSWASRASTASPRDGTLHCEADDFDQPNGLCLSPDERTLYVNDTTRAHIRAFDIAADGSLSGGRMFAADIGTGGLRRRRRRRHEVRRARQHLRDRSARHLGARRGWPSPRRHRDAGDRRQPELGRARLARPLLHVLDLDLSRADEGARQPSGVHAAGLTGAPTSHARGRRARPGVAAASPACRSSCSCRGRCPPPSARAARCRGLELLWTRRRESGWRRPV